jgi:predicted deacylase
MKRKITIFSLAIFLLSFKFSFPAEEGKEITIGNLIALPGQTVSGFLYVAGGDAPDTKIPISIVNGSKSGPILALIAGIHAYEYPPIEALLRLKAQINPKEIKGALLLVHIANLQAFQKRTIYYNPYDWLNLNRVFPGNPNGTISRRIAHVITQEIIKRSDYLIDLHCGDGNESLIPYSYWSKGGNPNVDLISKKLVEVFGIYPIIETERPNDPDATVYVDNTAIQIGKPAFTTESGQLGILDEESVHLLLRGVKNVMRYLKMIDGEVKDFGKPIYIKRFEVIRSNHDGIFYPLTKRGYHINKGEPLGYVTDYFGNKLETIYSPLTGQVLYIVGTPPSNKGEPLAEVGEY